MLMIAIRDEDKDDMVRIILKYARTSEQGAYGDGKISISPLEAAYTISSGIPSI